MGLTGEGEGGEGGGGEGGVCVCVRGKELVLLVY